MRQKPRTTGPLVAVVDCSSGRVLYRKATEAEQRDLEAARRDPTIAAVALDGENEDAWRLEPDSLNGD